MEGQRPLRVVDLAVDPRLVGADVVAAAQREGVDVLDTGGLGGVLEGVREAAVDSAREGQVALGERQQRGAGALGRDQLGVADQHDAGLRGAVLHADEGRGHPLADPVEVGGRGAGGGIGAGGAAGLLVSRCDAARGELAEEPEVVAADAHRHQVGVVVERVELRRAGLAVEGLLGPHQRHRLRPRAADVDQLGAELLGDQAGVVAARAQAAVAPVGLGHERRRGVGVAQRDVRRVVALAGALAAAAAPLLGGRGGRRGRRGRRGGLPVVAAGRQPAQEQGGGGGRDGGPQGTGAARGHARHRTAGTPTPHQPSAITRASTVSGSSRSSPKSSRSWPIR